MDCTIPGKRQLKEIIRSKRRSKLRADVHLLQYNIPVQTAQVSVAEAVNYSFEMQLHLDFAPSDFFPFSNPACVVGILKIMIRSHVEVPVV